MKLFFCLLSWCILLSIDTAKAYTTFNGIRITLYSNEDFKKPISPSKGHRSVIEDISVSAFLNDNHLIQLNFHQPIGEVEILISQDGETIYSSSENIVSPISKDILLPQEISGSIQLEIKGESGVYIYGYFSID